MTGRGAEAFQAIVDDVEYPVFVVTAAGGGSVGGCLVGFTTQCSIEPLRFLVCLSKQNATWEVAQHASQLAVHLVREDQHDVAEYFGSESSKTNAGKMSGWPLVEGPEGTPVLPECDWFLGRVLSHFDLGDHTGFLLEPVDGHLTRDDDEQLGYQGARDIDAGQPAGDGDS